MVIREAVGRAMVDFTQMRDFERDPLVLSRGSGIRVWDVEGKEYIDAISAVITVNLGYGNQRVIQAVAEQLARLPLAAPTTGTSDRMLEFTDQLLRLCPSTMGALKLHSGGSEAVEAALKMARQYHRQTGSPGKYKVISRYGSYHGATMGALSATGQAVYRAPYEPLVPGFIHVDPPEPGHDHSPTHCSCVDAFEDVIVAEGPETVAAVIVEPVMTMAGVLIPPPDYLARLRAICDRHGVLLIYDEIINAFGRLGSWFAADLFGTWPDLLVFGKGVTSGYAPLSGVIIDQRVADAFLGEAEDHVQFLSGHTYGGNPVACAAAIATIAEMQERGIVEHAQAMGERLSAGLASLGSRHSGVQSARCIGLLACVDLDSTATAAAVIREARHRGLLTLPSARGGVRLAPPLVVEPHEVDEIVGRLDDALVAVEARNPR